MLFISIAVFITIQLLAALNDVRKFIIPNWMSLVLIGVFPIAFYFSGLGLSILYIHLIHFAVAFLVGLVLFFGGVVGGGDAKLLSATALWVNIKTLEGLMFYQITALVGGAMALSILLLIILNRRKKLGTTGTKIADHFGKGKIPYGLAIASGGIYSVIYGDIVAVLSL